MSSKTLGILCYIDDTAEMLEEFSWIYKSWIFSGNWKTSDLIAICHPAALDKLPAESGVIRIPRAPLNQPGSPWATYPFINSIGCLLGEHTRELVGRYSHFLRTDADVFLTASLVEFRPDFAVFGRGRYAEDAGARQKIVEFAARHNLTHHGIFNCGSSLLTRSEDVLFFLGQQMMVCELLLEEFRDDPGQWPGWYRGVLSMYAAELIANHYYARLSRLGVYNFLDFESDLRVGIKRSNIHHIHAFHCGPDAFWSKHAYRSGRYRERPLASLDIALVPDYCHWLAITGVERIKWLADYPE